MINVGIHGRRMEGELVLPDKEVESFRENESRTVHGDRRGNATLLV